jgi:hypothetical protein
VQLETSWESKSLFHDMVLAFFVFFAFGQNSCCFLTKTKKHFAFLSVLSYVCIIGIKMKISFVSKKKLTKFEKNKFSPKQYTSPFSLKKKVGHNFSEQAI